MTDKLKNHRLAEFETARFAEFSDGSTAAKFGKLWRMAETGAQYPTAVLAANARWSAVEEVAS